MTKSIFVASLLSAAISVANAQGPPLITKRFTWDNIPYKVDTDTGLARGEQLGYNRCNSTTEGPSSLCQTAYINSLDDFCIWAPATPGHTVGEIEGEMIAWCTNPGHGTRVMPEGTITGVQFTRSPDYVQVVGFMDQTKINMIAGDAGGEMDPHGADLRGNPLGGLLFTNAFTGTYVQAVEWHNFNGGNQFCLKACDASKAPNDARLCEHIYDTQGCGFNAPSGARDKVFESCASNSQNPPGSPNGAVPPASSLCSTFASTDIYGPSATVRVPIPGASTMSFSSIPRPTPTKPSSSAAPSAVSSGSKTTGATPSQTNGAASMKAGFMSVMGMAGIVVSAVIFA